MTKVFIDGSAGTTGLNIYQRLSQRTDIELITLDEEHRKSQKSRKEALCSADIAFLCLPDAAAIESVQMLKDANTAIIDTSTAHRTSDGWCYGFAELEGQREKIALSKRIANPGCHASGFVSLIEPLVKNGILNKSARLSCFSLTGYSGGGKKMIADYEDKLISETLLAPRIYGLAQKHKHLPEMKKVCGLDRDPIFSPIVSSYYSGMEVVVPLFAEDINADIETVKNLYREYYGKGLVKYEDDCNENGFLSAGAFSGRDDMQISVFGSGEKMTLVSRFDNLGKGACGAAIQNMNILLGIDETTGLNIGGNQK